VSKALRDVLLVDGVAPLVLRVDAERSDSVAAAVGALTPLAARAAPLRLSFTATSVKERARGEPPAYECDPESDLAYADGGEPEEVRAAGGSPAGCLAACRVGMAVRLLQRPGLVTSLTVDFPCALEAGDVGALLNRFISLRNLELWYNTAVKSFDTATLHNLEVRSWRAA
jgi:hypothetical protein